MAELFSEEIQKDADGKYIVDEFQEETKEIEETEEQENIEEDTTEETEEIKEEVEEIKEEVEENNTPEQKELSKEERSIIKYKKENKALKEKLRQQEEAQIERSLKEAEDKSYNKYIEKGESEGRARELAQIDRQAQKDRYELNRLRIKSLEDKYPTISLYTNELIDMKSKYPDFTFEEIYKVKFQKESEYETKTKYETLYNQGKQEVENKTLETAKDERKKGIVLSEADRRAYLELKKQMPDITVQRFVELSNM